MCTATRSQASATEVVVSDKYALLDLKTHVEVLLAEKVDEESFFDLIYLADDHSCESLKQVCALYFAENRAEIVKKEEWGKLRRERSELSAVLFEAVALWGRGSDERRSNRAIP
jgi:hypothetical protein